MVKIRNLSLRNKTLTTINGEYLFDSDGIATVPSELAQKLLLINGFYLVEGDIPDTPSTGDVTLEGGIVWHPIEGGYIVSSPSISYTITGSAFDEEPVPPSNVTLSNDILTFQSNIDTSNIHVSGVNENDTILIGNKKYKWIDTDNNLENGLELDLIGQTTSGGSTYVTVDNGYIISNDSTQVTLKGVDINQVTLEGNSITFDNSVTPSNVHIEGIEENTTTNINGIDYICKNTDDNSNDLELVEIHSLQGNNSYIEYDSKYELTDSNVHVTVNGAVPGNDILISNGEISINPNADTSNIHVLGVKENDTLLIGDTEYKWVDTDNNSENGLELALVNPPIPLENGGTYTTIKGGYVLTDGVTNYTLTGDNIDTNHIGISNGNLILSEGISTENLHILGVKENDSIVIGNNIYYWVDLDNNLENGLELKYVPPTGWSKENDSYIYDLNDVHFTLIGSAFNSDSEIPNNVNVSNGKLIFSNTIDTSNIHVLGVKENDTLLIGDTEYKWVDTDNNSENGLELALVNPPIPLENGGTYTTIKGGYVLTDGVTNYTLTGDTIDTNHIGVKDSNLVLSEGIDTENLHVLGVNENDSIAIGDTNYIWEDLDNNLENGLELVEIHTLPSGGTYTTIKGGYVLTDGISNYTLTGDNIDSNHISVKNGNLILSEGIDTSNIHVLGVSNGDTVNIGEDTYTYINSDNNLENGYELNLTKKDGWSSLNSGYIYDKDNVKYTVSGSAVKSNTIIPSNIKIVNGTVSLSPDIDVNNIHILGVSEGDSIKIGNDSYIWKNTDSNEFNGLELNKIQALSNGGTYTTISGGFILTNGIVNYTLMGDTLDSNNIYIDSNNKLMFTDEIDPTTIHVLGVNENDSVDTGNLVYKYENIDGVSSNGYELVLISKDGWTTIKPNGYMYTKTPSYTIYGSAFQSDTVVPKNVQIINDKLVFNDTINTADIHIFGVKENDSVKIGNSNYLYKDIDGKGENGLELVEIHTLPSGDTYTYFNDKIIISNNSVNYTLIGSYIDENNTYINSSNELAFNTGVDIDKIHAIGVTNGSTLKIGNNTYKWNDEDNQDNGLELKLIKDNGWETVNGGYAWENKYTVSGSAVDSSNLAPSNIEIVEGNISLSPDIDVNNIHVLGVSEGDSIKVGNNNYLFKDTDNNIENGYELIEYFNLPNGGIYYPSDEGFIIGDTIAQYTVTTAELDTQHVAVVSGTLILKAGLDTDNFHIKGVNKGETILIGDAEHVWDNIDDNPEDLEPIPLNPPITLSNGGSYVTIPGGYILTDGIGAYTLMSSEIDSDNIGVKDGNLVLGVNTKPENIHILGVSYNDTIFIGENGYKWIDKDGIVENGYELALVNPPEPLELGGTYTTIPSGYVLTDGVTNYTLTGDTIDTNHIGVKDGNLILSEGINTSNIHILGVKEDDSIAIGNDIYFWEETNGTLEDGFELKKAKEIDGFSIDWDGRTATIEGGMKAGLSDEDIALGTKLDKDKLVLNDIIENPEDVHITGIDSLTSVYTDKGEYTLMDTDNNLENGLELVGGTDDADNWKYSNRTRPSEPQIWRHYFNDVTDIKVIGVTCRPAYIKRILTLIGETITNIINNTNYTLTIKGDVLGSLSPNAIFNNNSLLDTTSTSWLLNNGTLYINNGTINTIKGDFQFTLENGILTISSGIIDVDNAKVTGNAITKVIYQNKEFLVIKGRLARNAIKRNTIKVKP